MRRLLSAVVLYLLGWTPPAFGFSYASFQYIAFAANAGGQNAYALSWAPDSSQEFNLFTNQYLITGKYPLTGLVYNRRHNLLPEYYPFKSFVQGGVGMSTAGPLAALTWNFTALMVVRIDITTHIYFPQWLGITVPI
jgi:hypothetical protein